MDSNWQLIDNFSWKVGRHDIKFGYEFRRTTVKSFNDLVERGELDFNSLAEFLGGGLDGGNTNVGNTSRNAHQNSHGLYIQDGIHVNSRLMAVSYTHLDVYKRQMESSSGIGGRWAL